MYKKLVIVESPGKIKNIQSYLDSSYRVVSSYGHVRDLAKKNLSIEMGDGFSPIYVIGEEKKRLVNELKKLSDQAAIVCLATDDDREGEAISFHLKHALGLEDKKIERIVFREITKKSIQQAIKKPRSIDMDLVNSQQSRRILDRLVGYLISPLLWSRIRPHLSAGRVQSVAVKLIVEREREIHAFSPVPYFRVRAVLEPAQGKKEIPVELNRKLPNEEQALSYLNLAKKGTVTLNKLETKEVKRSPSAPLTTSTLQQEASQRLGYSVAQTMQIAQQLYEAGHITYMRTDSVRLAKEALLKIQQVVTKDYGKLYFQERSYKTRAKVAQEAHEAIRPTNFEKKNLPSSERGAKLYKMIRDRTIASQMIDAVVGRTTATFGFDKGQNQLIAKGEVVLEKGFLHIYPTSSSSYPLLPTMKVGDKFTIATMEALERYSLPPSRYNEASLVKTLEQKGIGRPSTYGPTIATIQNRGYVVKESREGKETNFNHFILAKGKLKKSLLVEAVGGTHQRLFPTDEAFLVTDFLEKNFPNITSYNFTAGIEEELDAIAHKKKDWQKMLKVFYNRLLKQLKAIEKTKPPLLLRELGIDPKTKKKIFARFTKRHGPLLQMGEENPTFVMLPPHMLLEDIKLEEALPLFSFPRDLGLFEESPVSVNRGKYGPYVRHQDKFYSLGEIDPYKITKKEAVALIETKRKELKKSIIKKICEEPRIYVLNGRFGPYIKTDKANISIPKQIKAEELTLEQAEELISKAQRKKKRVRKRK